MNLITGEKLKEIIIICSCLFVTLTNCDDERFLQKRSAFGPSPVEKEKNSDKSSKPIVSLEKQTIPTSLKSDLNQTNELKNQNTVRNVTGDVKNVINDTITSKVSANDKNNTKNTTGTINKILSSSTTPPKIYVNNSLLPVNTGALMRGVFVFLGLSLIVVAYIIFRCARLNKNRTQMVRKYGILAHRQDVEMRPLPLDDEDEDDNTVFDASEVVVHDKQRRST